MDTVFYYDVTSPSCLRFVKAVYNGKINTGRLLVSANDPAGTLDKGTGYYRVCIKKQRKQAHRVVWELHYGITKKQIDHINGIKTDNRIENLREVDARLNKRNQKMYNTNTTGVTGVEFVKGKDGTIVAYRAAWRDIGLKSHTKTFSLKVHGDEAFNLAKTYRQEQICALNTNGAGYTGRHGK